MLNHPVLGKTPKEEKWFYHSLRELVHEWQSSETEQALWDYLGITEKVFKEWMTKCKFSVIDA